MAIWLYTPYTVPLLLIAAVSLLGTLYGFRHRGVRGGLPFTFLVGAVTWWLAANILEVSRVDESGRLFWANMQYLGIVSVPVAWFIFAFLYTGQDQWRQPRRLLLLGLEPLLILVLIWTNDFHHLFRVSISLDTSGLYPAWDVIRGPAFWLHTTYSYLLLLAGTIRLLAAWRRARDPYRQQMTLILIGAAIPWLANGAFILGLFADIYIDPTPLSFFFTSVMVAWAIYGFRLMDLAPVARRIIIDSMADGMIVVDDDERIVDLNPRAEQLLRQSSAALLGQPLDAVVQSWPELNQALPQLQQRTLIVEQGPAGARAYFEARCLPLRNARQERLGSLYLLHEITDQVNAQEAYQTLVKRSLQGLAILQDNQIVFANQALADIAGYSIDALLTLSPDALQAALHPDDRDMIGARIQQLGQPGMVDRYESRLLRSDGSMRWIEQYASVITYGDRPAIQMAIIDITERKLAEEAMLAAQRAAEEANQAKSDFLANMTHEIRTPINAVMGMSELLMQTELSEQQQSLTDAILQSSEQLSDLVSDILDFSKIEARKMEVVQTPFNVCACVDQAVAQLLGALDQKGLALNIVIDPGVPEQIYGDPVRLRQVLINLLNNAIKFTETGTVSIAVNWEQQVGEYRLRCAVADTGIGIPADRQHLLFQPFSQVDGSMTRRFGGTGLGLSISKELVQLMGGQIWFESKPGQGSTFYFTVNAAPAPPAGATDAVDDGARTAPEPEPGVKILVVEDDFLNRALIVQALQQLGYAAHTATNGQEGVAAAMMHTYDIIFMDIQMPIMDGVEAMRRIRQQISQDRQPYIIALTANATLNERARCLEAGADDFIAKPYRLAQLRQGITKGRRHRAKTAR